MEKKLDYESVFEVLHEVGRFLLRRHEIIKSGSYIRSSNKMLKLKGEKYGEDVIIAFSTADLLKWQKKGILEEEITDAVQVVVNNLIVKMDDVPNHLTRSLSQSLGLAGH